MQSPFDPYYTWLGIPAAEQPPHHYRLLGLSPFETDLNAISHASDRQQGFLKLQAMGEHGPLAEQLIRAMKTAERCLLDPRQKSAYDDHLRIKLVSLPSAVGAADVSASLPPAAIVDYAPQPQVAVPVETSFNPGGDDYPSMQSLASSPSTSTSKNGSRSRRAEPSAIGRLVAVLLPTAVIGGILLFVGKNFLSSSDAPPPKNADVKPGPAVVARNDKSETPKTTVAPVSTPTTDAAPNSGTANTNNSPFGAGNVKPPKSAVVIPKPTGSWNNRIDSDANDGATSPASVKEGPVDPTRPPDVTIRPPLFGSGNRPAATLDELPLTKPAGEKPATEKPTSEKPTIKAATERLPVPDAAKQDEARKLVLEVFGKEITAAKTPAEKTALAAKLLQQAQESKSDPPGCYVLILTAREAAFDASDLDLLLRTVDAVSDSFNVSAAKEKLAALTTFSARATKPAVQKATAEAALQASRVWGAAEDFENAIAAARLAYNIVTDKSVEDPRLSKVILAQGKDLVVAQARRAAYLSSLEKLKTQPDDPEANLNAGRWLWFVKQDFAQGATYLARSSDADLKPLAEKELAATKDAAAQAALGDDWWNLSQKTESAIEKSIQLRRADYWYRQASPSLTGLIKAKVDKRIEEMASLFAAEDAVKSSSDAGSSRPPVIPGKSIKITTEEVRTILSGNAFEVLSRDGKKKAEELDLWEFSANGDVFRHGVTLTGAMKRITGASETIGRWEIKDNHGVVKFTKSPMVGTFQFASKTDGNGVVKSTKGDLVFGFQFKKVVPVAKVTVHSFMGDTDYTLYSNGAIGSPTNANRYWALQGLELTIHDRGDAVYTLSEDKKSFSGRSPFGGPDVRGEVTFIDPPKE